MSTPIDIMMEQVDWAPVEGANGTSDNSGLPHATHHGELMIGPYTIRCYRLNDGRAILNAGDIERILVDGEGQ